MKRCPVCKTKYEPVRPGQKCCLDPDCAATLGRMLTEKAARLKARQEKQADKVKRESLKTMAQLRGEAQTWFNRYIRLRDAGKPCISCGRHHTGQYHAGHYLTVGAHPELRFDPKNAHLQCQPCNTHLSGNLIEYRKGLIARYGQFLVDWLEGPHEPKHYVREDILAIKEKYRKLCRMMELHERNSD